MANRKHIPRAVELAAALLQLVDGDGKRLIPHEHAKLMTADQIISLFARDHYPVRVADGGPDEPWNITWRLRHEHKVKTAMVDLPHLGKQRRIRAREKAHQIAMNSILGDLCDDCPPTGYPTDKTRCLPCPLRKKIQSRPFPKGRKFAAKRPIAF